MPEPPQLVKKLFGKFKEQHIYTKTFTNCDKAMSGVEINLCKEKNTFILASTTKVKSVCRDKGEPYQGLTKSLQRFDIVVCKLEKQGTKPAKCHYSRKNLNKKIVIKCEKGLPVHYVRDIDHCEN
uniref:Ribonuclease A-domain domain-containing protein n=1 Tax=Monopterus albus TaxID=43700 RepID=A0A3Q3J1H2_MONAL